MCDELTKATNVDGAFVGYPGLEAIFEGFGLSFDCITRFEASNRPTLQISLHIFFRYYKNWMIL